tara:strand:- start:68 stop:172 length:105 start_codon:yes stop_codon:yes gene_type:complete
MELQTLVAVVVEQLEEVQVLVKVVKETVVMVVLV